MARAPKTRPMCRCCDLRPVRLRIGTTPEQGLYLDRCGSCTFHGRVLPVSASYARRVNEERAAKKTDKVEKTKKKGAVFTVATQDDPREPVSAGETDQGVVKETVQDDMGPGGVGVWGSDLVEIARLAPLRASVAPPHVAGPSTSPDAEAQRAVDFLLKVRETLPLIGDGSSARVSFTLKSNGDIEVHLPEYSSGR